MRIGLVNANFYTTDPINFTKERENPYSCLISVVEIRSQGRILYKLKIIDAF